MLLMLKDKTFLLFLLLIIGVYFFNNSNSNIAVFDRYLIVEEHEYWRVLTHSFVHVDLKHLLDNLIGIVIFRYLLKETRFIQAVMMAMLFTFITSVFYIYINYPPTEGFSSAMYGLIAYYSLQYYFNRKEKFYILIYFSSIFAMSISFIFEYYHFFNHYGVAHAGHLFSIIIGTFTYFSFHQIKKTQLQKEYI